jgi:NAD(P)-dependent dehydrogenase (short-subunit alcohol dehydrogenase family)
VTISLITGANKGLGYEAARRLKALGHTVVLTARDPGRGQGAAEVLGVRFVRLDVSDDDSVAEAAENVKVHEGHIDVLINNAGIAGTRTAVPDITAQDALTVYNTNVVGIVRVTSTFLPLLRLSDNPVIVNVSSGMGSFAMNHDPGQLQSRLVMPLYQSSKAAVGMLTVICSRALPDMRVNAVAPGFTATDFNDGRGTQTVTEGTDAMVALATIGKDGPTGTFQDRHGTVGW